MAKWTIERHNEWVKSLNENEFKSFSFEHLVNGNELVYRWFVHDYHVIAAMTFIIDVSYNFSISKYVENKKGILCFDEAKTVFDKDSVCNENGNYKALAKTCKEWVDTFKSTGLIASTAIINYYSALFADDDRFRFIGESEDEFGRKTLGFTFSKGNFHVDPSDESIACLEIYDEETSKKFLSVLSGAK